MSIKKKINFIFFYSFYRPGPGPAPTLLPPLREKGWEKGRVGAGLGRKPTPPSV